ncbi:MAG: hypothetical protein U0R76_07100 [Candidatus Nanopelagicales bacterium]
MRVARARRTGSRRSAAAYASGVAESGSVSVGTSPRHFRRHHVA